MRCEATTWIIPISEGGENSEGGTNFFLNAMRLVPPKDLGIIVHPGTIHSDNFSW